MRRAVCAKMGKERLEWMRSDPDFDPIRGDPRFASMVETAKRRIAANASD